MSSQVVQERAEMFADLQNLDVPERIITGLDELNDLIVSGCVAVDVCPEISTADSTEPIDEARSAIIDRICEGVIAPEELRVLQDVAAEVVRLRSAPSEQVKPAKKGENLLTDQLLSRYFARKDLAAGVSTRRQRKLVSPAAQQFFEVCDSVAEKGVYLLSPELMQEINEQEFDNQDQLADLLVTMSWIDLITFARSVPADWVDAMDGYESVKLSTNRECLEIDLIDTVYDYKNYKMVLRRLFKAAPRRRFDKLKLKSEFAEIPARAIALHDTAIAADEYRGATPRPEKSKADLALQSPKIAAKQARLARQVAIDLKRAEVLSEADQYFKEQPTIGRMLGALGVETCIETIYASGRDNGIKLPQDLQALHIAVDAEARVEQRAEAIHQNSLVVQSFVEAHHVTAAAIRSLDDKLALRRGLEGLVLPGSGNAIFSREGAQQVAGIALRLVSETSEDYDRFWGQHGECAEAASVLHMLHHPVREAKVLLDAVDALIELGKGTHSRLLGENQFRPIRRLLQQRSTFLEKQKAEAS